MGCGTKLCVNRHRLKCSEIILSGGREDTKAELKIAVMRDEIRISGNVFLTINGKGEIVPKREYFRQCGANTKRTSKSRTIPEYPQLVRQPHKNVSSRETTAAGCSC